jgi:hypothetical protein
VAAAPTPKTWAFYLATTKGNKAEREVRLYGGFREFAGTPVFDLDALERMRPKLAPGRTGRFEKTEATLGVAAAVTPSAAGRPTGSRS